MNLQNWIEMGRKHWKEHLPTRYRELKQAGTLDQALNDAAEQTYREVSALEENGFSPDEAWQMTRETYLLPPAEGSEPRATSSISHDAMKAVAAGQRTMPAR